MIQDIIRNGLKMDHLYEYLKNDEGIKAAITNAVHRFYFDYCFSPYNERPYDNSVYHQISQIHSNLIAINPMWRITIRTMEDRYLVDYSECKQKHYEPSGQIIQASFSMESFNAPISRGENKENDKM